jgi:Raf kinase inhibitor-like YbhB/YbcL family protein
MTNSQQQVWGKPDLGEMGRQTMMRVKRWLAGLVMLMSSFAAATAQNAGNTAPPPGPTIMVPKPSSVAEPVSGGGPAPAVEPGPGYPRQPTIRSAAFDDYGWLPLKYAANAAKMVTFDPISPPLVWTEPPPGTLSVVLAMIDMETSSGGNPQDRLLWAVINMPPSTRLLAENTTRGQTAMLPAGAFQLSYLTNGYIGPLPGANLQAHHYLFELYTLDRMLEVPRDVTLSQLKTAIRGHQTGQRGVMVVRCCTNSK